MKLIPEARSAWRLLTIQIGTLVTGFGLLPPDQQAAVLDMLGIPPERVLSVVGVAFLLARLVKQKDAE